MFYLLWLAVPIVLAFGVFSYWFWKNLTSTIIYQYQKGLLFKDGLLVKQLDAGHYRYFGKRSSIEVFDMRKRALQLSGQEILTKDNIGIRITVVGQIQITDAQKIMKTTESYMADVYAVAQLCLRDVVGEVTLDELLATKSVLDQKMQNDAAAKCSDLGVAVSGLAVRDIMLPANLKKAYGGVLEAQKDALRNVEKARGEQAVLRSLANSSKLYSENPLLLQARVIQALATGNNSIVFGADEQIAVKKSKQDQNKK
jgi:regulator of protease activity HflC (stomatin/prohibitin superfamily)